VTAETTPSAAPGAARLRAALADHIAGRGTFRTPQVEAAFRAVPRHLFLPGTGLEEAYAPQVVITKRGGDGAALSSASSPNLVAAMLEQLAVRPGDRILEIGTGTGFNAALLAELAGTGGQVTTIDIDEDITGTAGRNLGAAGYRAVRVVCAGGAGGYAAGGPYDRIIVTAGAHDLPAAWWQQLASGGRLVVPLTLHGSGLTRSVAFDRQPGGHLAGVSALVCGFVPMRGSSSGSGRTLALAGGVTMHVDASDTIPETALAGTLRQPAPELRTGIMIGDGDPDATHLDLWLATAIPAGTSFGRISAEQPGQLTAPARRWAGAAVHNSTAIAYLTLQPGGESTSELAVTSYGRRSEQLAAQTAGLLHQWSQDRPLQPVISAYPAGAPDRQLPPGLRIDRLAARLTVHWEHPERT
jgi:protein-L-isoaspartate(D-aspartate) O-methyltransferase